MPAARLTRARSISARGFCCCHCVCLCACLLFGVLQVGWIVILIVVYNYIMACMMMLFLQEVIRPRQFKLNGAVETPHL